jgi:hypothetical protein
MNRMAIMEAHGKILIASFPRVSQAIAARLKDKLGDVIDRTTVRLEIGKLCPRFPTMLATITPVRQPL